MSDDKKKISFGFSKLVKKPNVVPSAQPKPAETIQFIDIIEDNNIKVFNEVKKEETVLVIPMKPSHSSSSDSKEKIKPTVPENPLGEVKPQTLDELAAKEIVDQANMKKEVEEKSETFTVPLVSNPPVGEKQSTLEDYDNIPVEKFGLAMLRGMGFKPGEGIGKNGQVPPPLEPVLRPKGMGLGADKAMKATQAAEKESKDLKMGVGSHVRLISGTNKDMYGKVEGFIEESGRVIVKLARTGKSVIVGEFVISLVTPDDYSKNSKVLNIAKYEKYKSNEKISTVNISDDSDEESSKDFKNSASSSSTSSHRSKYDKERSRHSDGRHRSKNDSDDSSSRSRHENGRSRHSDERHRSRNDSDCRRDRDSSRRDYESRKHHSDRRYEDRDYHHKSSKYSKHSRDRSPRRD